MFHRATVWKSPWRTCEIQAAPRVLRTRRKFPIIIVFQKVGSTFSKAPPPLACVSFALVVLTGCLLLPWGRYLRNFSAGFVTLLLLMFSLERKGILPNAHSPEFVVRFCIKQLVTLDGMHSQLILWSFSLCKSVSALDYHLDHRHRMSCSLCAINYHMTKSWP